MKKAMVLWIILLSFVTSAFAEPWRVFDNAGLFTAEDTEAIEIAIADFQRETNCDFAVLTTDDYIGKANWKAVADSFYDSENFGFGSRASGMLYYIDMNQRVPYISTTGEMVLILDDNTLSAAHETCYPFLACGLYKNAVLQMIESARNAVIAYKKDAK